MGSVSFFVFFVLSHLLLLHSAEAEKKHHPKCPLFHCGHLGLVGFPFANSTECGPFILHDCDQFQTPKVQLEKNGKLYDVEWIDPPYDDVEGISQRNHRIGIKDEDLWKQLDKRSCESFDNWTLPSLPKLPYTSFQIYNKTLFKCDRTENTTLQISDQFRDFFNYPNCSNYVIYYYSHRDSVDKLPKIPPPQCSIIRLPLSLPEVETPEQEQGADLFKLVGAVLHLEVYVSPDCFGCHLRGGQCLTNNGTGNYYCTIPEITEISEKGIPDRLKVMIASGIGGAVLIIITCFFVFIRRHYKEKDASSIIYFSKEETLTHQNVEAFLRNYGALAIRRYSYSDIERMTNSFKDKLGQGGYGGVYKGELEDGSLVAVKVLEESKGNGEEFINEVASISRTSHVNIVTLMGFCFEGCKRALIYEFMPNGSLEKFIYKENPSRADRQLGWETLYKVAIGIARGLEYLHKGCNTRILHFDIKPHNILLDEEFCPKISDFGLAKICPRKESIISMVGARGTIGFIAPEVFCRNFGGVSHKSDVYSYGMMVLEMVGGRKNFSDGVDRTSEIYFPHWIYKRLEVEAELGLKDLMNENDEESVRKMIIVGLWCIQTDPSIRPTISKVMEMLEGSLNSLQIPPKPFLSSPIRSLEDSSPTLSNSLTTMVLLQ